MIRMYTLLTQHMKIGIKMDVWMSVNLQDCSCMIPERVKNLLRKSLIQEWFCIILVLGDSFS